ncbi:MAG: hypothetical protein V3T17_07540 [Pseudomonadales bacterium]
MKNATITIDAMGCQRSIAAKIRQLHSGAMTMATLKRFYINLLSTQDTSKRRMKHKVMAAAIDDEYRAEMLFAG